jgi:hypothetical protein
LYEGKVWLDTSTDPAVTKYYTGTIWSITPQNLPFVVNPTDNAVYMTDSYIRTAYVESLIAEAITADRITVTDAFEAFRANIGYLTTGVLRDNNDRFIVNLNSGFLTVADTTGQIRVRLGNLTAYSVAEATAAGASSYSIYDNAATISAETAGFINGATDIDVADEATVAQAALIYTSTGTAPRATGAGNTWFSIADTAANIVAKGSIGGVIAKAVNLFVEDNYTQAQKDIILGLRTGSVQVNTIFRGSLG